MIGRGSASDCRRSNALQSTYRSEDAWRISMSAYSPMNSSIGTFTLHPPLLLPLKKPLHKLGNEIPRTKLLIRKIFRCSGIVV